MEDRKSMKTTKELNHNVILENREKLSVSGVVDVDSFDEKMIVVFTEMEMMTIKGDDLHIVKLNLDVNELMIEGEIESIVYSDEENPKNAGGLFAKLFK